MTELSRRRPPYILDQPLNLLADDVPLEQALTVETLRAGKRLSRANQPTTEMWTAFDRERLLAGIVAGADSAEGNGVERLRRVLVSVEAGMGKSKLLAYLRMELSRHERKLWPVLLDISQLPGSIRDLPAKLLERARLAPGIEPGQGTEAERQLLFDIRVLLAQGRVLFLLDGLDQVDTNSAAMNALRDLLRHQDWSRCGFVIAGRPYAMLREKDLWLTTQHTERHNDQGSWRVARLEEFDEAQQRAFLGQTTDSSQDRLELIPSDAWSVLNIPRVLEYLYDLPDADLRDLRTPSDVYWRALGYLVDRGLNTVPGRCLLQPNDQTASESLRDTQREAVFDLLGAMAFQMVVDFSGSKKVKHIFVIPQGLERFVDFEELPDLVPPNSFDHVPTDRLTEFKEAVWTRLMVSNREPRVWRRMYAPHPTIFDMDFVRLAQMNVALEMKTGFSDSQHPLQFRNRSLQEWFAAYWLARHCTDAEADEFWNMVYQAGLEQSEAFYWINRYLSEMPKSPARDDEAWVRAASVWYHPGDGTVAGTKRSAEMLFRSWRTMHELAGEPVFDWWDCSYEELIATEAQMKSGEPEGVSPRTNDGQLRGLTPAGSLSRHARVPRARDVLAAFHGEFQRILDGSHGDSLTPTERATRQQAARELCENFIPVGAGQFKIGSRTDGISKVWRSRFKGWIERYRAGEDATRLALEFWCKPYEPTNVGVQRWLFTVKETAALIRGGMEAVAQHRFFRSNEIPQERDQVVAAYELSRYSVINAWFELFAPGHGRSGEWFAEHLSQASPSSRFPVIYLDWYQCWAFAVWTAWKTETGIVRCRLPHEPEFEYVAKDREHPDWQYWWGDDFEESTNAMCNADGRIGSTRPPEVSTPSFFGRLRSTESAGFHDLLGNVNEWMANRFQIAYSRQYSSKGETVERVIRGGAWSTLPEVCCSTFRLHLPTDGRTALTGFRLVCVRCSRTS